MFAVIQAGQATVAKASFLKPAVHSVSNDFRFADRPALRILLVVAQADCTAGLVSKVKLLSLSKYVYPGDCPATCSRIEL